MNLERKYEVKFEINTSNKELDEEVRDFMLESVELTSEATRHFPLTELMEKTHDLIPDFTMSDIRECDISKAWCKECENYFSLDEIISHVIKHIKGELKI